MYAITALRSSFNYFTILKVNNIDGFSANSQNFVLVQKYFLTPFLELSKCLFVIRLMRCIRQLLVVVIFSTARWERIIDRLVCYAIFCEGCGTLRVRISVFTNLLKLHTTLTIMALNICFINREKTRESDIETVLNFHFNWINI